MDQKEQAPSGARRAAPWLRRVALGLLGLAVLWLVTWLAVPPLLTSQAEQRLGALLGREVRIGAVDFAPWSLALTVHDLRIAPAGGVDGPPQFRFARLFVDASASSLFRLAPVLEAVELDEPQLRLVRRADGSLDIDDIAARLQPPAADARPAEPARFALYNLQLRGGSVEVDDQAVQQAHVLKALHVGLPFLSNLPADIAVKVEPRVAFELDGSAFDSGAQLVPFAERRSGAVQFRLQALDLARWAAYVPATVPLKLRQGRLDADLQIDFAQAATGVPTLVVRGRAGLADLVLTAAAAAPGDVVGWRQLDVAIDELRPLERKLSLGDMVLDGARVDLRRDADGRLALQRLFAASPAARPATPPASAASAAAPAADATWSVALRQLRIADAAVAWNDASVRPAAALRLEAIGADIGPFRSDDGAPAPLRWSARLAADGAPSATLAGEGRAGPQALDLGFDVQGLAFAPLAPYVAPYLVPRLDGRLSVQGRFEQAEGDAPKQLLAISRLQVDALALRDGDTRRPVLAQWQALEASDGRIDLQARRVAWGRVVLRQPQIDLARTADGRIDAAGWLPASTAAPAAAPTAPAAAPPWQLTLRELQIEDGRVGWRDARAADGPAPAPVAVQASALRVALQNLQWPASARTPPATLTLSTQLADLRGARPGTPGRIDWRGQVGLEPLAARGDLRIERLPAQAFAPYVPTRLQLVIAQAEAGWRGRVALQQAAAGLDVSADGDAQLGPVKVHAREADGGVGDELLAWQRLSLAGLRVRVAPGAPPDVQIREAALADFYSRLVITEQGRFNLRDVAAAPAGAASAAASAPAPASPPAAAASAAPPLTLAIESTRLTQGRVDFTDRFVKPNYSAALSELEGVLGPFRTGSTALAPLTLHGRVAGTGALEIAGSVNPMAQPLALDVRAKAHDIELSPLSPYSARYAGYGIERGKLGMEVAYKIDPDGRLNASNRVVLNQLTFGERVDSPEATKLPVALAIALLKDRHGVIDLDLPVSGSLNDPQFSIFGIVMKLIGNLLVKAVTAPFSLLFGGGGADDGGLVAFVPGTVRPTPAGSAAIDKVAKALADRPALSLTLTGHAEPASEREALRGVLLEQRLAAERRRTAGDDALPPTPAERDALLKRLYDATKLPDKPRNFVGLAKSLPPVEMEVRLRAAIAVDDEQLRELAQRRGFLVRDALLAKGLDSDRLFVAAPRLSAATPAPAPAASDASAVAGRTAEPGVQLELATQ